MNEVICTVLIIVAAFVAGGIGYGIYVTAPKVSNYIRSFIKWHSNRTM